MALKYPNDFLSDMENALGDDYPAFFRSLSDEPVTSLRLNPRRPVVVPEGIVTGNVPWEADGRYVISGFHPGSDPVHFAGGYYMQEASAMAPANVLGAVESDVVLDLCAAPGSKAGQLAGRVKFLVANEPNPKRAAMLAGNLERLGIDNCCVVSETPTRLAQLWPGVFDAILVDAPCSGEGMFRRDAASMAEWSPKRVLGCAERQREILASAVKMLKPSGRLVYSTCTFNRYEDEDNARWLAENFDLAPVDFALAGAEKSQNGCLKLWPHEVKGEGQFMALFQKGGRSEARESYEKRPAKEALYALEMLYEALGVDSFKSFKPGDVRLFGSRLCAVKDGCPDVSRVKTYMTGLALASVREGYVVPEHALAMSMSYGDMRSVEADLQATARFMAGEELEGDTRSWALVTYLKMPLGFCKGSQGRLRNHLPKGIRIRG